MKIYGITSFINDVNFSLKDRSKQVVSPEGLEFLIGKRIKTAVEFFKAQWKERSTEICEAINNGTPFNFIY